MYERCVTSVLLSQPLDDPTTRIERRWVADRDHKSRIPNPMSSFFDRSDNRHTESLSAMCGWVIVRDAHDFDSAPQRVDRPDDLDGFRPKSTSADYQQRTMQERHYGPESIARTVGSLRESKPRR
jgi:hypothetical protein